MKIKEVIRKMCIRDSKRTGKNGVSISVQPKGPGENFRQETHEL